MTTDDETARALARWLDTPGSPPPAELDRGVIEAIYALRPDLAPAPRLTADDILATVARGPLAGGVQSPMAPTPRGGEVVAFPGDLSFAEETADTEPEHATRAPRWWWWAGGTGGVGLAIAAAATLTLIALPEMPTTSIDAGEVLLGRERTAEPASSLSYDKDDLADEKKKEATFSPEEARLPASSAASAPKPAVSVEASRADAPLDMVGGDGVELRDEITIPEVASGQSKAAGQVAEDDAAFEAAPPPPPSAPASESEEVAALAKENEVAQSAAPSAVGGAASTKTRAAAEEQDTEEVWRQGVDNHTLDRIDDALRRAERVRTKDPAEAASILAEVVGPPAAAGQHVAALAAADYLTAGDPDAAQAIARQGLLLSEEPTADRSKLQVLESEAAQRSQ